jgi:hypothetical protein
MSTLQLTMIRGSDLPQAAASHSVSLSRLQQVVNGYVFRGQLITHPNPTLGE